MSVSSFIQYGLSMCSLVKKYLRKKHTSYHYTGLTTIQGACPVASSFLAVTGSSELSCAGSADTRESCLALAVIATAAVGGVVPGVVAAAPATLGGGGGDGNLMACDCRGGGGVGGVRLVAAGCGGGGDGNAIDRGGDGGDGKIMDSGGGGRANDSRGVGSGPSVFSASMSSSESGCSCYMNRHTHVRADRQIDMQAGRQTDRQI